METPYSLPPIFSYFAHRFVEQREDLATEGLSYLLNRSGAARAAMVQLLWVDQESAPGDPRFGTQATGDDQARPDLIGKDANGRAVSSARSNSGRDSLGRSR